MEKYSEKLLQYIVTDPVECDLWYKARHYVLNIMPPLDGAGIGPDSGKRVHVVVNGSSPLMMAVVRQICLLTHYPNFDEETGRNRTLITISDDDAHKAYNALKTTRFLGALLDYCHCTVDGRTMKNSEKDLPLDIEFQFVTHKSDIEDADAVIDSKDVEAKAIAYKTEIDVTKGMLINMVYNTGAEIDNLPASDNANISRYTTALNVFCYHLKTGHILEKWGGITKPDAAGNYNLLEVKNKLSSVFCADCLEGRVRGMMGATATKVSEYSDLEFKKLKSKISDVNTLIAQAKSEHARWNVEKIIMGFRPLGQADWYSLETCFGAERKQRIKSLKKRGIHIDLCSYKDLRRIDPGCMKYDYFIMLAMPYILRTPTSLQ